MAVNNQSMRIMTWNANGVRARKEELALFCDEQDISVVLLSETHLKPGISWYLRGFQCIRKDREIGRAGGVAVLVRNNLCARRIDYNCDLEAVGAEVELQGRNHIFAAVYKPPNDDLNTDDIVTLTAQPRSIIGGDWNCKHPSWGSRISNPNGQKLFRTIRDNNIVAWGPEDDTYAPSRGRGDVLDFFLAHQCNPHSVKTHFRLDSDHYPVTIELGGNQNTPVTKIKTDWLKFEFRSRRLGLPNALEIPAEDLDREAAQFTTEVSELLNECQSTKTVNSQNSLSLLDNEKALVRQKNGARKRWNTYGRNEDRIRFRRLQREVKLALESRRQRCWESAIEKANDEQGKFWKLLRRIGRSQNTNSPLEVDGHRFFSDSSKASQLADHLEGQFSNDLQSDRRTQEAVEQSIRSLQNQRIIDAPEISLDIVKSKIDKSSARKAAGADNISNLALKHLDQVAVERLTRIFQCMISNGIFPRCWKSAEVIMIPKGTKDPKLITNLRPISLLSCLAKLGESIIKDHIQQFLEEQNIIKHQQFGFRPKLAAVQQAAKLSATVKKFRGIRNRKVMAACLDVEKAYDRVWRDGLIHKMCVLNFPVWITKTVNSWRNDRVFCCRVGKEKSTYRTAREGLPQGSSISPLLYNIFVYDMPTFDNDHLLEVLQFADDTAIVASGTAIEFTRNRLEGALAKVKKFAVRWKITINQSKTEAILFGRELPRQTYITFGEERVRLSKTITYLGLKLDRRLSLMAHTKSRCALAEKRLCKLYCLTHPASGLSSNNRLKLFRSGVWPMASYGQELGGTRTVTVAELIRRKHSKMVRRAMGIPWFIRNQDILEELQLADPVQTAEERQTAMEIRLLEHEDENIKSIGRVILDWGRRPGWFP